MIYNLYYKKELRLIVLEPTDSIVECWHLGDHRCQLSRFGCRMRERNYHATLCKSRRLLLFLILTANIGTSFQTKCLKQEGIFKLILEKFTDLCIPSCVNLGELFILSVPQILHL